MFIKKFSCIYFSVSLLLMSCVHSDSLDTNNDNAQLAESLGCQVPEESSWNWSLEELVKRTNNIYIVRAKKMELKSASKGGIKPDFTIKTGLASHLLRQEDWALEVILSIKGNRKKGELVKLSVLHNEGADKQQLHPVLCEQMPNIEKNSFLVVFENSFHPDGYKKVSGLKDPWVVKVRGH